MERSMNFSSEAWGLHPKLDMPDLFPPAVMFSIHNSDPHPKYRSALQKLSELKQHGGFDAPPVLTTGMMRQLTLRAAWDSVFHEVPGDRIGLLYQNAESSSKADPAETLSFAVMIKSTEPPGKKWIVTRATEFRGKTVCWCVPVEVARGEKLDVELTADNMITLESE
jgi:hypothetical protein